MTIPSVVAELTDAKGPYGTWCFRFSPLYVPKKKLESGKQKTEESKIIFLNVFKRPGIFFVQCIGLLT